ncbi:MAG: filamentous hemagglutinin N-terminal domain-containing protein [bacterium]
MEYKELTEHIINPGILSKLLIAQVEKFRTMKKIFCTSIIFLVLVSFMYILSSICYAEVISDSTLGQSGKILEGPDYLISEDLGKNMGTTLFHSFEKFTLNTGESATFTGPATIENVISRVTGGEPSWIDGRVAFEIQGANLFFINPWGVMFGPHAQLDVTGSFHVTTADYIRLGENGRFNARQPENDILIVDPPSAFGFLDQDSADISMHGSFLQVPGEEALSLVGGDVELTEGSILFASGGRINVASTASSGEVALTESNCDVSSFDHLGTIQAREGSYICTNGEGGGRIFIRGHGFVLDNSNIWAETLGEKDGDTIDISLHEDLIVKNEAKISGASAGAGRGSNITVKADEIDCIDDGVLDVSSFAEGYGGDIRLEAKNVELKDGGRINLTPLGSASGGKLKIEAEESVLISGTGTLPSGIYNASLGNQNAGCIEITTSSLKLTDNGYLLGVSRGEGAGAHITMEVDDLEIAHGGTINISSLSSGQGGSVEIKADDSIVISGSSDSSDSKISSIESYAYDSGDAGMIDITTSHLSLTEAGFIGGEALGGGNGPDISVQATGDIVISGIVNGRSSGISSETEGQGDGGHITIEARSLSINNRGVILGACGEEAQGNASDIQIKVENLDITEGGAISSTSLGEGEAGAITIVSDNSITVSGRYTDDPEGDTYDLSFIASDAAGTGTAGCITISSKILALDDGYIEASSVYGTGDAGTINVDVEKLRVSHGSQITTSSHGSGHGGDLTIYADESIHISDPLSSISSSTSASGDGGTVFLHTPLLVVENSGAVNAVAVGEGDAGDLHIEVDNLTIHSGGCISANTVGSGHGGNITVDAHESILISHIGWTEEDLVVSGITSMADGPGAAGSITINSPSLHVTDDAVIIVDTLHEGNAGDIILDIETLILKDAGSILANTDGAGHGGNIRIEAADSILLSGYYTSISSSSSADLGGDCGSIFISTPHVLLDNDGGMRTVTLGSGEAGTITLDAKNIDIHNGGYISVNTEGSGHGGNLEITASEAISLSGKSHNGYASALLSKASDTGAGGSISLHTPTLTIDHDGKIDASTLDEGRGGNITVNVAQLHLGDGALIEAQSAGMGDAGNIVVRAENSIYSENAHITTEAYNADGGNITITTNELIHMVKSDITATVKGGMGNGGNIEIGPQFFILNQSTVAANAEGGDGGNITIVSDVFLPSLHSLISASSRLGIDGTVEIISPYIDMSSRLALMPASFLNSDALLPTRCDDRRHEESSSFVLRGRSGFPLRPDRL